MSEGWIKLYRSIEHNPIVNKDPDYFRVWCHLLLQATHTGYDVMFNGKRIKLKPGQFTSGRKRISEATKVNESKVTRILKTFESEQQIEQQTTSRCTLITILNWDIYQHSEQQIEQQLNSN